MAHSFTAVMKCKNKLLGLQVFLLYKGRERKNSKMLFQHLNFAMKRPVAKLFAAAFLHPLHCRKENKKSVKRNPGQLEYNFILCTPNTARSGITHRRQGPALHIYGSSLSQIIRRRESPVYYKSFNTL
jgi:hypothetical protein